MNKQKSKTKIICTLGPASSEENVLKKMMDAGMNIARLNFSHSTLDIHLHQMQLIRKLNKKYRFNVKILGDLEGYRIRVGRLKEGKAIKVIKGQIVWLTQENILGDGNQIPFDYTDSLNAFRKGQRIFIDDGNIALSVLGCGKNKVKTRVEVPGIIKERKGINMPDIKLSFKGLTEKDKENIRFCMENKIDYLTQSFVRSKDDILIIKEYIKNYPYKYRIIAKIENREGIINIDEIIDICDGIMVARGDMGVSIPIYEVPIVQKEIIKKCNRANKFVITATQMLESMSENYIPTRAEVSDVANAVLDGSDYVMLSAETAVGLYPVECVVMMKNIIKFTETHSKDLKVI